MVTKGNQPLQYSTQNKKPKSQKQMVKEKAASALWNFEFRGKFCKWNRVNQ